MEEMNPAPVAEAAPRPPALPTPLTWRLCLALLVVAAGATAVLNRDELGNRARAAMGFLGFLALAAACSANLRRVNWLTVLWGILLQIALAFFILKFQIGDRRPGYEAFDAAGNVINHF